MAQSFYPVETYLALFCLVDGCYTALLSLLACVASGSVHGALSKISSTKRNGAFARHTQCLPVSPITAPAWLIAGVCLVWSSILRPGKGKGRGWTLALEARTGEFSPLKGPWTRLGPQRPWLPGTWSTAPGVARCRVHLATGLLKLSRWQVAAQRERFATRSEAATGVCGHPDPRRRGGRTSGRIAADSATVVARKGVTFLLAWPGCFMLVF